MKVYVAGPMKHGDLILHVRDAIFTASELLSLGHIPFVPHLTILWHLLSPESYETWLKYDLEWVKCCDALIRLPGVSSGADGEVAVAQSLGIPVYYSIGELVAANRDQRTF